MILRQCSQGHKIRIRANNSPSATRTRTYEDGTVETITYSSNYKYFLEVDGTVSSRSNSWKNIQAEYLKECAKVHSDSHGEFALNQKLINGVVTNVSELPTMDKKKTEIKTFLDSRFVAYGSSDTKAELIARL
jgi:hypothetical protein